MKQIVIYLDDGVSLGGYRKLVCALQTYFSIHPNNFSLKAVNRSFFLRKGWEPSTALIIFPGGRDRPYHHALSGEKNSRIQTFIKNGGRFLGLCAGAYYGSSFVEFDKGGALEVREQRELGFFPGKAVGPAYKERAFSYDSEEGSRASPIMWEGGVTMSYFNGGCLFEGIQNYPSTEIIGRYQDLPGMPAAVIFCKVSLGAALLCGIHPEYNPNLFWNYILNKILT